MNWPLYLLDILTDLLASVPGGVVEGELGDAFRLLLGDHLEAFDDASHRLVLQRRVLAL